MHTHVYYREVLTHFLKRVKKERFFENNLEVILHYYIKAVPLQRQTRSLTP